MTLLTPLYLNKPLSSKHSNGINSLWSCVFQGITFNDELYSLCICVKEKSCWVVEEYAYAAVTELVSQTVLVWVVHPFANPQDWCGCWVLGLVWKQKQWKTEGWFHAWNVRRIHSTLREVVATQACMCKLYGVKLTSGQTQSLLTKLLHYIHGSTL